MERGLHKGRPGVACLPRPAGSFVSTSSGILLTDSILFGDGSTCGDGILLSDSTVESKSAIANGDAGAAN